MRIIQEKVLSLEQKNSLMQLWNNEYPDKLKYESVNDFNLYLDGLSNAKHHLFIDDQNKIKGWAFAFLRDNENWFAIIIDSQLHGKGKGRLMIEALKKNNDNLNGWVVDHENDIKQNKEAYKSPLLFYMKNDFIVCKETRIENEKISAVKINWKR
ncbi:hypothetical protein ACQKCJ_00690 [Flavobacterium sp. NPDC079362]|uniref:hypothetical protein n=1 Tax=Flavobacterium sp. NPDC079362 TaxID=3390566 RepID=UPI003D00A41F